jgi:hypothetical protein
VAQPSECLAWLALSHFPGLSGVAIGSTTSNALAAQIAGCPGMASEWSARVGARRGMVETTRSHWSLACREHLNPRAVMQRSFSLAVFLVQLRDLRAYENSRDQNWDEEAASLITGWAANWFLLASISRVVGPITMPSGHTSSGRIPARAWRYSSILLRARMCGSLPAPRGGTPQGRLSMCENWLALPRVRIHRASPRPRCSPPVFSRWPEICFPARLSQAATHD